MSPREQSTSLTEHVGSANARMVSKLFFRLLPVQVLRAVMAAVNSLVVTFFASNFVGGSALSAWGLYGPIDLFIGAIATVLVAGSQVLCGRYMGMNREDGMQSVFALDMTVSAAFGVILAAAHFAVSMLGLTALFVEDAAVRTEFNVVLIGVAFNMIPYMLTQQLYAFISLEQQNKRTMAASFAAIATIIGSCYLLICVFDLGALGLALSPGIANCVNAVILGSYFFTDKATMRFKLKGIDFSQLKEIILIGLPAALLPAYQTLRGIIVNGLILAYVGAAGLSAFAAASSLLNIFWAVPAGIQSVSRVLFSMYVGEQDRRSLADTMRTLLFKSIPLQCAIVACIIALAYPFTCIFFHEPAEAVFGMCEHAFRILPLCMPLSVICMGFTAYGQSADKHLVVHIDTALDGVVCVAGFSALLIPLLGIDGLYWANVLNGVVCVAVFPIYAALVKKGLPRTIEELMVIPHDFGAPDNDRLDISIRSLDEVAGTAEEVQRFCRAHGVSERTSYFSALCMEEMAANIVEHGFTKDRRKHSADVRVVYTDDDLILRIKDDCVPFDPDTRRKLFNPDDPVKNIGVHLVYGIADSVEYRHTLGLNVLTMRIAHEKR